MMAYAPPPTPEHEGEILTSATIRPHEMQPVLVGEYESEELVPKVATVARAGGWDKIGWTPSRRIMDDSSVRLTVMVQNFTDQPVTVDVYQDDNGI